MKKSNLVISFLIASVLLSSCNKIDISNNSNNNDNQIIETAEEIKERNKREKIEAFRYEVFHSDDNIEEDFKGPKQKMAVLGDTKIQEKDTDEVFENVKNYVDREKNKCPDLDYIFMDIFEDRLSFKDHLELGNFNPEAREHQTPKMINAIYLEDMDLYKITEIYKFIGLENKNIDNIEYEIETKNDKKVLNVSAFNNKLDLYKVCENIKEEINEDVIEIFDLDGNTGMYDKENKTLFIFHEYTM